MSTGGYTGGQNGASDPGIICSYQLPNVLLGAKPSSSERRKSALNG